MMCMMYDDVEVYEPDVTGTMTEFTRSYPDQPPSI